MIAMLPVIHVTRKPLLSMEIREFLGEVSYSMIFLSRIQNVSFYGDLNTPKTVPILLYDGDTDDEPLMYDLTVWIARRVALIKGAIKIVSETEKCHHRCIILYTATTVRIRKKCFAEYSELNWKTQPCGVTTC